MFKHMMLEMLVVAGLLVFFTCSQANAKQWKIHDPDRPVPPVVTPGPYVKIAPPSDAIVLFNGTDIDQWEHDNAKRKTDWKVKNGEMVCQKGSGYIRTKKGFGDCQLHVEWAAPTPVKGSSQGRGNSGVFLMGIYEVQVLDCYQNKTYADGYTAAVYGQNPPAANVCRKPGQWNTYDIIFRRPRFDKNGKVTKPATLTVIFNGVLVQNNFTLIGPTAWKKNPPYKAHPDRLPLKFQDHGNPVRFQNVWIRDLETDASAVGLAAAGASKTPSGRDDSAAEKLGWKLSLQCWTRNRNTLFETIDIAQKLGLRYIEMYPGQKVRKDSNANTNYTMKPETMALIKAKLNEAGVHAVAYGVVGLPADEKKCRQVFAFCKAMGIEQINSEPKPEAFDAIEKLVQEFDIKVGLHNHPKPSYYWTPDRVNEVIKGRDNRIGFCADTGHWCRSNLEPVEMLETNAAHIKALHIKELNKFGTKKGAHDVPWGTGNKKMRAILTELKRQNFKGVMSIEYEHWTDAQLDEIAQCIKFFDKTTRDLVK